MLVGKETIYTPTNLMAFVLTYVDLQDSQGSVPLMETPSQEGSSPNELTSSESKKTFLVLFLRHLSTQCQILERILTNL
jgi:hypothetical protein